MRIVFLNTLYPPFGASGAEVTLRLLVGQMATRGHDCSVVSLTPEKQAATGRIDDIAVQYLPLANVYWPHGGRRPALLRPVFQASDAFNPIMERRLAAVLQTLQPDVINAHNLQGFSVSAWRAAKRLRIPLVQTLHDYYTACPRSAMWRPGRGNCAQQCPECRLFTQPRRAFSSLPAAITCVSHRVLDRIAATGMFAAAASGRQPARIIRGGNPQAALPPLPSRHDGGPRRFGFMGRLDPAKGLENLIDAMALLPPGRATLAIAGSGPAAYAQDLQARAAGNAAIAFLGHVTPASFFDRIDVLVIPSVWEDPFPRVFHEAMAYGVPSLVTPLGGLPEAIEHGRTGFVARGCDASALREAMQNLIDGGWNLDAVRAACRHEVRLYDPGHIVSQYEAALSAAAGGGSLADAGEAWIARPAAGNARHGA